MYLALSAALTLTLAPRPVVQTAAPGPDTTIDASTRSRVIQGVLRRIQEGYVFPDKGKEMAQAVQRRAGRGEYDSIVSARAFAERLTGNLRSVSHDLHLQVACPLKGAQPDPRGREGPGAPSQAAAGDRRGFPGAWRMTRVR
jgi:hypothetical protein